MGKSTISMAMASIANCKRLPESMYIYIYYTHMNMLHTYASSKDMNQPDRSKQLPQYKWPAGTAAFGKGHYPSVSEDGNGHSPFIDDFPIKQIQ